MLCCHRLCIMIKVIQVQYRANLLAHLSFGDFTQATIITKKHLAKDAWEMLFQPIMGIFLLRESSSRDDLQIMAICL